MSGAAAGASATEGSTRTSSRQSPLPGPTPPDSPLAEFPRSKSVELKCAVRPAPRDNVIGPRATPASSNAVSRTVAAAPRLIRRAKPWLGRDAAGNRGTWRTWALDSVAGGAVDRFAMCPVGFASKLNTRSGLFAATVRRHLPAPAPKRPSSRSCPPSKCCAVKVYAARGGTVARAGPALRPVSSTPRMVTCAGVSPELIKRNRLCWLLLVAGLKNAMRCKPALSGAGL